MDWAATRPKSVPRPYYRRRASLRRHDGRGPHPPMIELSGGVDMRNTILTVALAAMASPLGAQAAQQAKDNDPTHKVAGGISVAGWMGRLDPQAERRGMKLDDAKFAAMGSGYHVTSGPAAIYWNPKDAAKGSYTVSASFTQTKAPMHPEAYGLSIGGTHLSDTTQSYVYF